MVYLHITGSDFYNHITNPIEVIRTIGVFPAEDMGIHQKGWLGLQQRTAGSSGWGRGGYYQSQPWPNYHQDTHQYHQGAPQWQQCKTPQWQHSVQRDTTEVREEEGRTKKKRDQEVREFSILVVKHSPLLN